MHFVIILALTQVITLTVGAIIIRRQLARDSLAFRALGWNDHREQVLALLERKHPRDCSGKFTTKKEGGK